MPINKIPIAKRAHKKSRNGCQQCKTRKVKCDERKPLCGNCKRHFYGLDECDFPTNTRAPPAAHTSSRHVDNDEHHTFLSRLSSTSPIGSGIDPFSVHPDSNVPEAQFLMHHYFSNFTTKTFPIVLDHETPALVKDWWAWAGHDPVLFHATLHLSSFHLASLRGEENTSYSRSLLKRECIRLLRERIEDSVLGISDETIGSILFLAIVEFERGNFKMVRMHVDGLKRIVKLRGGLNVISAKSTIMANMIFGITMTVMTEPQFPPETDEPLFDRWGAAGLDVADPDFYLFETLGVATYYASIIREVKYVTAILLSGCPGKATLDSFPPNYCSDIQSRLHYLRPPTEEGPMVVSISESTRIATAIVCLYPFKNDYPSPALMMNVQLHKLKAALEVMIGLVPPGHELLPWLLGCGCIWSVEPEKSWFLSQLITVADDLHMHSYEDYRAYCVRIIWVEAFFMHPFKEVWEEVATRRDKYNML